MGAGELALTRPELITAIITDHRMVENNELPGIWDCKPLRGCVLRNVPGSRSYQAWRTHIGAVLDWAVDHQGECNSVIGFHAPVHTCERKPR